MERNKGHNDKTSVEGINVTKCDNIRHKVKGNRGSRVLPESLKAPGELILLTATSAVCHQHQEGERNDFLLCFQYSDYAFGLCSKKQTFCY